MKTLMRKILPVFMAVSFFVPLAVASESAVADDEVKLAVDYLLSKIN